MALATRDALLHVGFITAQGVSDILNFYSYSSFDAPKLGSIAYVQDSFGLRIFRAGRILQSGGLSKGVLSNRAALVTGARTAASGELNDTTHLASTSAFTLNNEEGKVCQINVDGAAAPEGQCAFIVKNTVSQLTFDPLYPLSVTTGAGATFSDWAMNQWVTSVLDVNRIDCGGILMSAPDTLGQIAWQQIYGFHPAVIVDALGAAPTAGAAGVSGTAGVRVRAAETEEDYVGWFPMATSTTAVVAGFVIDCWTMNQAIA